MERIQEFLRALYRRKIEQEFDALILVVADEGMGKSTFMVEATGRWQHLLAEEGYLDEDDAGSIDTVLSRLVWDQDGFKQALADYPRRSAIPVMDAARVLQKKKAMHTEQIEVETDLLDSRMKEQVIFLGYQDWEIVPKMLQRRRAKYLFRIPYRGRIEGYSRESMDELFASSDNEWPEPDLVDSYPDLSGTEIWDEFKRRDREKKEERMRPDDAGDESEKSPKEIAGEISQGDVDYFLSVNNRDGSLYIDHDVIALEYEHLSVRQSKQVRKLLERDDRVTALLSEKQAAQEAEA